MRPVILATDGGPHSAHKWAIASSQFIADLVEVDPDSMSEAAIAARKARALFQFDLTESLEDCHATVQDGERAAIAESGTERPTEVEQYLDAGVACVRKAAEGTLFAAHFAKPAVDKAVRAILANHFGTSIQVERGWHRDRTAQKV